MTPTFTILIPPSPEFCFLGIDWWATCMSKAEWSGWMQAIFSVAAIFAAIGIAYFQRRSDRKKEAEINRVLAITIAEALVIDMTKTLASINFESHHYLHGVNSIPIRPFSQLTAFVEECFVPSEEKVIAIARVWPQAAQQLTFYRANYHELVAIANGKGGGLLPPLITEEIASSVLLRLNFMKSMLTPALTELTVVYRPI